MKKSVPNVERASFWSSNCKERHIIASHLASSSGWPTLEEVVSEFYCPATESNEKSWQHSFFLRLFENLVSRNWHRQTWNPALIQVVVIINLNVFPINESTIEIWIHWFLPEQCWRGIKPVLDESLNLTRFLSHSLGGKRNKVAVLEHIRP